MLSYFQGDELPEWVATVTSNGEALDFSSGWDFTVTLTSPVTSVTKTSDIAGTNAGAITVAWDGELDIAPGQWKAQLTASRQSDSRQVTIEDIVQIKPRALAE